MAEMTPLERAARALPDWEYAACPDDNPDCPGGLACPKNQMEAARAVLLAIREPSDRMQSDGAFQLFRGVRITEDDLTTARQAWRAMIAAALDDIPAP